MNKNKKETNKLALILGGIALLALIAFLCLGVGHVDNGNASGGIIGFCSTFGIDVKIGHNIIINGINWYGLLVIALILIAGVCTAYLSKYGYGWFYFSSIVLIVAICFVFSYHTSWIRRNCDQKIAGIGAGQIVSGSLLGIMCIANFVAAYQQKNKI